MKIKDLRYLRDQREVKVLPTNFANHADENSTSEVVVRKKIYLRHQREKQPVDTWVSQINFHQ